MQMWQSIQWARGKSAFAFSFQSAALEILLYFPMPTSGSVPEYHQ